MTRSSRIFLLSSSAGRCSPSRDRNQNVWLVQRRIRDTTTERQTEVPTLTAALLFAATPGGTTDEETK